MSSPNVLYSTLLTVSATVSAVVAIFAWRRRSVPSARAIAWLMCGLCWWAATYALHWTAVYRPGPHFWVDLTYAGVVVVPTSFFVFALRFTHRDQWLTTPARYWLLVEPLLTLLLLWTDPWHGLFFAGKRLPDTSTILNGGPWFWTHIVYTYTLLLIACLLLGRFVLRKTTLFRGQATLILAAALLPWLGNVIGLTALNPLPNLDLTPIFFTLTGILLAGSLLHYRLFDLLPVARSQLFESMQAGVIVLDVQNRVVDINPAALRFLALSTAGAATAVSAATVGQPGAALLAPWDVQLPAGTQPEAQSQLVVVNGRMHLDLRVAPLTDNAGQLSGRLITLHDITDRTQLEQALRRQNEELEAFAHTVAHDLKGPLGVLLGYTEVLPDFLPADTVPSESAGIVSKIQQMGYKMNTIIDELLLLTEIQQQAVSRQSVDMAAVLAEVMPRIEPLIAARQAVIDTPASWPAVWGYAPWLEEVWTNLLDNALKYGGDPPRITLGADVQPDGMVRFFVRDNGPGIAPEAQALLFTEFTRLGQVRTAGHGLGLSIIKRIITRLDGRVGVSSTPGRGSTFYFCLPPAPPDGVAGL
ncbi:MAG: PAS domain-containing protein [Anaerolineales bacterium]|nr:PAS domain-containing protein [Anaerolineales bacterium]